RDRRYVVLLAEVREHDMPRAAVESPLEVLGDRVVREMTMPAEHALLERPRIGTDLEHGDVVVRFQDDAIRSTEAFDHELRDVAEAEHDRDLDAFLPDRKCDRVQGIVRYRKRREEESVDVEWNA